MKKILSALVISSLCLFASDSSEQSNKVSLVEKEIKANEMFVTCVTENLKKDKNQFVSFIKSTPKEKLTYQTITEFVKTYTQNLIKEDICINEYDSLLEYTVEWDKKLSQNSAFSKPADFDFAAYNKNLIFDMTASHIYFFTLLQEK